MGRSQLSSKLLKATKKLKMTKLMAFKFQKKRQTITGGAHPAMALMNRIRLKRLSRVANFQPLKMVLKMITQFYFQKSKKGEASAQVKE